MNFSIYPIKDSDFHKNDTINLLKTDNCINTIEYKETCTPNVASGYHKPLNELCKPIQQINNGPLNNCTSLWNNKTRRKSLIKDY